MEHRTFRAMGTSIELFVDTTCCVDEALDRAEAEFHRLEAILSRFREDSDLSRLNHAGEIEACSDLLRRDGVGALRPASRRGGRFDPTVHDAIVAAGYDRTFDSVLPDGPLAATATPCGGKVMISGSRIALGSDVRLDFGGIGKGFAVERAAQLLATAGPCLVSAGGDLAVRDGAWPIGVQTADGWLTLELTSGGLATSGRDRRRWLRAGRELHHLIDPTTGTSAEGDLLRASVVAPDAIAAEVWAKALFLAGGAAAAAEADARGIPAVLVTTGGRDAARGRAAGEDRRSGSSREQAD